MRKTILYIAMSLDGFIADRQPGVQFVHEDAPACASRPANVPRPAKISGCAAALRSRRTASGPTVSTNTASQSSPSCSGRAYAYFPAMGRASRCGFCPQCPRAA